MPACEFVPAAEAAFIAELSDRQIHRLADEELVPASLLLLDAGSRRFSKLACAFGSFYFSTEDILAAASRRRCMHVALTRLHNLPTYRCSAWSELLTLIDWTVLISPGVTVDLLPYISKAATRAQEVDTAEALVTTDPEVMGGLPCFAGTRVPIGNVLGSLDEGIGFEEVKESYPFLTAAHVDAARVYAKVHPARGRPRRRSEDPSSPRPPTKVVVRREGSKLSYSRKP